MGDTRHARAHWSVGEEPTYDGAYLAVLMDLRDLLDRLVAVLECPNFTRIPVTLRTIARNTHKKKRATKVPAHR